MEKTFDPFLLWKETYEQTEKYFGNVLDDAMKREQFSQWMGTVLNFNLQLQSLMKEGAERYLAQVNVPSKEDIANVAALVVNVEEKLETLEEMREEIKRVEAKLDELFRLFEKKQEE
ncbi:polyhydroxyalkanoic acid synthase PhaR subunit [Thermolongibacillus altinsuensis]|jgi:polyhydroxyalkanoic acid synthase PhaR subunit|uniref:Polyhydroxyalkanoic acid synthase PhaR subunit n=1 Tax=Thermolongibacillus altinsuensis TaxID=575256 RepID=A0A4R1QHE2_9BACL|nr:polyhydroxyalkanoic acid synthase subunit PhaR [Thermolongibacillus altinsuensis]TCL49288.1 polyhydroxyalkanoic acid synthase PhaR subunit [Thermolongibacillus altinsuensis]GMB10116.1 polyhydroxyalkanoic acid synthase subunit PhaR [Thermolongibacillus altinsuensis]